MTRVNQLKPSNESCPVGNICTLSADSGAPPCSTRSFIDSFALAEDLCPEAVLATIKHTREIAGSDPSIRNQHRLGSAHLEAALVLGPDDREGKDHFQTAFEILEEAAGCRTANMEGPFKSSLLAAYQPLWAVRRRAERPSEDTLDVVNQNLSFVNEAITAQKLSPRLEYNLLSRVAIFQLLLREHVLFYPATYRESQDRTGLAHHGYVFPEYEEDPKIALQISGTVEKVGPLDPRIGRVVLSDIIEKALQEHPGLRRNHPRTTGIALRWLPREAAGQALAEREQYALDALSETLLSQFPAIRPMEP